MIISKSKKIEYEHFDKLSEEWWKEDGKFKILHKIRPIRIEYILKHTHNNQIKNYEILDIGCGGGLICESLSKLGGNVTGVDFVEKNIQIAKKHAKINKLKINYMHGDIEKIRFKKKFDIIIMFEVLEHLDDWRKVLKNKFKILKNNGTIIISTINRNLLSKYLAINVAENILRWIPKNTHDYEKFIKPEEIFKFSKEIGFKVKDIRGYGFDPIDFEWKINNNHSINYFCSISKIN